MEDAINSTDSLGEEEEEWLLKTFTQSSFGQLVESPSQGSSWTKVQATVKKMKTVRMLSTSFRKSDIGEDQSLELTATQNVELRSALDKVGTLDFDIIDFAMFEEVKKPLTQLGSVVIRPLAAKLSADGIVPEKTWFERVTKFLDLIEQKYRAVPYHNSLHAGDTLAAIEWVFRSEYLQARTTTLDRVLSLIAASVHDVAHPGKNNIFEVKTQSTLAMRYNDVSILESMHAAVAFETMKASEASDWWNVLPIECKGPEFKDSVINARSYARNMVIQLILHTDMSKHQHSMNSLRNFIDNDEHQDDLTPESKLVLLSCIMHAADVSNPVKPRPLMLKWTKMVIAEFWDQGDAERQLDLPISPLCDRVSGAATVPQGQLGFIQFIVRPLFDALAEVIPEVGQTPLEDNVAFWEVKRDEKATYEDIW
jgi:cAMP-specific phosphodiesterase 4